MLDEFCSNTRYNRKYAIRLLNGPHAEKRPRPRRQALGELWSGSDPAVGGGLGGGWLSLVGSLEGRAAVCGCHGFENDFVWMRQQKRSYCGSARRRWIVCA